jgi:hypothetical protein
MSPVCATGGNPLDDYFEELRRPGYRLRRRRLKVEAGILRADGAGHRHLTD